MVQLDDLVRTILFFLQPAAPTRIALEIAGPERLSLDDVLIAYRRWLGHASIRACDGAALAGGHRVSPGRSHRPARLAAAAALHGAARDRARRRRRSGAWTRLTGIAPRTLGAALAAEPASVQERWFAQLYFLKPLVLAVLALYWIVTGLVALGPGAETAVALMRDAGVIAAGPLVAAGAIADIADRRRHRDPAHGAARALRGAGAVARLRRARHGAAAAAVGRSARAPAEDRADHRAQSGGAGDPGRPLMTPISP